jgi:hypothetical protein
MAKEERWGEPARKHLLEQCEISTNEVIVLFDLAKLVYEVKSSCQTNVGGEISGGHIFRVKIGDVVSCTFMTPTLLHLPCSHVIIVCRMRHVLHEGSNQMSLYYSLYVEEKTWTTRFEFLFDPSQWPVYGGRDYVPDVAMRKMRKGYGNDTYGSGDFDQMKNKVHYSVCHGEGHTMNRHKQGPKRNPRARAATGRSRRSGPAVIVEVTHTSNIEKLFFMLLCTTIIFCICN